MEILCLNSTRDTYLPVHHICLQWPKWVGLLTVMQIYKFVFEFAYQLQTANQKHTCSNEYELYAVCITTHFFWPP